jgi:hypothetical protein
VHSFSYLLLNCRCNVMVSVIASSTVNRGVDPRSDQRDRLEYCKSWGQPPVWSAWSPRVYCKSWGRPPVWSAWSPRVYYKSWGRPPVWSKTIKKSLKIPKGVIRNHKSKVTIYTKGSLNTSLWNRNKKPLIEGQTKQWSKEEGQKDKQWFIKHDTEN